MTKKTFLVLKTSMEPFLVGFEVSGVGFGAAMWGSEVILQIMGFEGQKCGTRPPSLAAVSEES